MTLATPTQRAFNALWPANAPLDWKLPTVPPTQGEEWFLYLYVLTRWEIVQPVPTKAFLLPAKTAAMGTACCDYACLSPPSHFLLAQNLSSKWISPTDKVAKVRLCNRASSVVKGLRKKVTFTWFGGNTNLFIKLELILLFRSCC